MHCGTYMFYFSVKHLENKCSHYSFTWKPTMIRNKTWAVTKDCIEIQFWIKYGNIRSQKQNHLHFVWKQSRSKSLHKDILLCRPYYITWKELKKKKKYWRENENKRNREAPKIEPWGTPEWSELERNCNLKQLQKNIYSINVKQTNWQKVLMPWPGTSAYRTNNQSVKFICTTQGAYIIKHKIQSHRRHSQQLRKPENITFCQVPSVHIKMLVSVSFMTVQKQLFWNIISL